MTSEDLDMSDTIIARSDQLNADDLITGPRTIKITKVSKKKDDQPVILNYVDDGGKPFKPCKTVRRLLAVLWGKDGAKWNGHSLVVLRDPDVKWGGVAVGGIRISHATGIQQTLRIALQVTKGRKEVFEVEPLAGGPATRDPTPEERKANAAKKAQQVVAALATEEDVAAFVEKNKDVISRLDAFPELKKLVDDAATARNEELKAKKEAE